MDTKAAEAEITKARMTLLFDIARLQAMRVGLPPSEWEDCAIEFCFLRWQKQQKLSPPNTLPDESPSLLRHCARQYAIDYQRRLCSRRETLWHEIPDFYEDEDKAQNCCVPDVQEAVLCHIALPQRIDQFTALISEQSAEYIKQRFCLEKSFAEIAAEAGKPINTVEQCVTRSLKKLRAYCTKNNLCPDALDTALYEIILASAQIHEKIRWIFI